MIPQNVKPFSSFSRIFPLFFHFGKYISAICGKSFNSFRKVSCLNESLFRPRKSPILRSKNVLGSTQTLHLRGRRKDPDPASGRGPRTAGQVRLGEDRRRAFRRNPICVLPPRCPHLRRTFSAKRDVRATSPEHEKGPRPNGRGPGILFRRCAYSATFALRVASSS